MRYSLRFLLAEAKKEKKIVGKNYTQFYVASLLLFYVLRFSLNLVRSFVLVFFLGFGGFEMDWDSTQCESDYSKWNGYEFVELFVVVNSNLTNNLIAWSNISKPYLIIMFCLEWFLVLRFRKTNCYTLCKLFLLFIWSLVFACYECANNVYRAFLDI